MAENLPPGCSLRDLDPESDEDRLERLAAEEDEAYEKAEKLNDGL